MAKRMAAVRRWVLVAAVAVALSGCGESGRELDPTPEKLDGTPSQEFEPDDIERAREASPEVQEYCSGAVSEAQRLGCESHVEDGDIP